MALEKNQFWQKRPNFGIHGTGKEPNLTEMVLEKNPLWHKWYWKRSNFYINGNLLVKIAVFTLTFKIASGQLELHYETHQWIPLIQTSIQTQHSFESDFHSNTTFHWFRLSFKRQYSFDKLFFLLSQHGSLWFLAILQNENATERDTTSAMRWHYAGYDCLAVLNSQFPIGSSRNPVNSGLGDACAAPRR